MGVMNSVSKPLLGVLLAAVALFASVFVFFKGNSASTGGTSNAPVYQSAINQAKHAVKTSDAANARIGAPVSTTPAGAPSHPASASHPATAKASASAPAHKAHIAQASKPAADAKSRAKGQVAQVDQALARHQVVGLLFYNPAAADDQAVKGELAAASTHPGVVKIAVPVSAVSSFTMLTNTVPVTSSPTLILIDRDGDASTITGFADRFEIAHRLNALVK
jgi:hypothetical protein